VIAKGFLTVNLEDLTDGPPQALLKEEIRVYECPIREFSKGSSYRRLPRSHHSNQNPAVTHKNGWQDYSILPPLIPLAISA
jgi:hypothetical protein